MTTPTTTELLADLERARRIAVALEQENAQQAERLDTIRQIASEPDNFYNKPDPGQLNTIFTRIAADLQQPAARLIDDDLD